MIRFSDRIWGSACFCGTLTVVAITQRSDAEEQRPWAVFGPDNKGGRPPGVKNKLALRVFQDVLAVWGEPAVDGGEISKGVAALRTLFTERPLDFCKVVASILPRDFVIESNAFSEMDDRKLEEISALAQRLLEERIDEGDESGTGRTH